MGVGAIGVSSCIVAEAAKQELTLRQESSGKGEKV